MKKKITKVLNNDIFIHVVSIALTLFVAAGCVGAFEHKCTQHGANCLIKH